MFSMFSSLLMSPRPPRPPAAGLSAAASIRSLLEIELKASSSKNISLMICSIYSVTVESGKPVKSRALRAPTIRWFDSRT